MLRPHPALAVMLMSKKSPAPNVCVRPEETQHRPGCRGFHSFTLELNLSTFGTHSWVKLGTWGTKTAQVELKCERV